MSSIEKLTRRRLLQLTGIAGGGLVLAGLVPALSGMTTILDSADGQALNIFVSVRSDGGVEIIAHRSEMGTGIRTSLPQVVADEMGANWEQVKVIQGLANSEYGSQNTDGSRSVRDFYTIMRQIGASARFMLEEAAAQIWDVPHSECVASDHQIKHTDGRVLAFGELATRAAKLPLPSIGSLALKAPEQFKYIGKNVPIVDLHDMTSGNASYGIDVSLPGMLYACIERAPFLGAQLESFEDSVTKQVKGVVQVLSIEARPLPAKFNPVGGVAVIATNTWSAMRGKEALKLKWRENEHAQHDSNTYLDALEANVSSSPGEVVRQRGDVDSVMAASSNHVEATFRTPYLAHASMEPPMATAFVHDGICEIWTCTQAPQVAQAEVSKALGIDKSSVKVHVTLLGGGFGRKSKPDYIVEAALLARQVGKPVQVVWSREDDIRHDFFHACCAQYYKATLDDKGKVVAWLGREAAPPIASTFTVGENLMSHGSLSQTFGSIPFDIPNIRLERSKADGHTRIGWIRSVYDIPFGFGVGSFVDELAHRAGKDPRDFLLELIGEDRHLEFSSEGFDFKNQGRSLTDFPYETARLRHVVRDLTARIPWGEELPEGEGWGLCALRSFLSYVAVAVKVKVSAKKLVVTQMHCVADCGTVVNPDRVHAQLEGAMVFGLSLALMGEITFEQGVPEQSNFHDYPVARINQVPAVINTYIVPSEKAPSGIGEPGVPPVAPAIANAVFAAVGRRVRELPLNKYFTV